MNKKAASLIVVFLSALTTVVAQTTYLPLNTQDYNLLDRIETRSGRLSDSLYLSTKPVMRNEATYFMEQQLNNARYVGFSAIDRYNMNEFIAENGEWTPDEDGATDSKRPWFHTFYKKQHDFIYVKTKNFFLVANPVISAQLTKEQNNGTKYWSSRGVEIRGWIAKKIGFYTYATDNQEEMVSYMDNWVTAHHAVPGADYYLQPNKGEYDYFLAQGYFDFSVIKNIMNVTFGYDKHFIGDGVTSLFLSDFSASAPFLQLTTRIWKLNYQNLYMELTPQYGTWIDRQLPHKYATIHHLSINATRWLNIGFYESVIFDRTNSYEISYLNPIIFYRSIERSLGSPDNENLGFNVKILAAKHLQFYGQLMLDEFKSKELFGGRGWWGNKFGVQLGGKYFDAFGVKDLDLQAELNLVRPYTYSHDDTIANFTHYNQPLAHPLGADFEQVIGIARYQPTKHLYLSLKGMYYIQGVDTGGVDFGSDPFLNYDNRAQEYGVKLINGVKVNCKLIDLKASYELRPNLFFDLGITHRAYSYESGLYPDQSTTFIYGGMRLNIAPRDYTFY